MVLSITAFCIRIYLRNLAFQETLVFSPYSKVVGVFGLHLCEVLLELNCFFYSISKEFYSRVRKKCDLSGLLPCFRVITFDDIFLTH